MAKVTSSGGPSIYGDAYSQFAAQNGITTEQDLIRLLNDQQDNNPKLKSHQKKAGQNINNWVQTSNEKNADGNPELALSNESSFKLCTRIWSGYTKFIRSQCNKDRLIDSIYFGTFFKKDSVSG